MSSLPHEAGTGTVRMVDQVQLRLGILRGLCRFFEKQTRPDGALICPRHKVEHTGKIVYAALLNLESWRYTREEEQLAAVKRQVLRTVDHLGLDPESQVPVFLPGRVDPRNASTNSIDGGACADVIATVLEELPDLFDDGERSRCREALERHVELYLRHSARDRSITAQRLWAGTGTARAARLLGRDDWAADALAGCALALDELAPDGVAPYIPEANADCTHPGLADTSGFYHSRTPAFVLYVHEVLRRELDARTRERIKASLDALVAMRDGNGHKVIHDEAKAWYWESAYEVASHPFDAYALHVGARVLDEPAYDEEAGRVMEEWIAHLDVMDGGVRSHHGKGTNFQCRVFWSGHAAWVARILATVPLRAAARTPRDVDLASSGLLHVERPRYTAVLRGRRKAASNLFGCDVGGGALQSLVVRGDPRLTRGDEVVRHERFVRHREGSFRVRPASAKGWLARLREVVAADRSDLKFRVYIATVELKAGNLVHGLLYPVRHVLLRTLREASAWSASHCDLATEHDFDGRRVVFRGGVADRFGRRLDGVRSVRTYVFEDDGVLLDDRLELEGLRGALRYRVPRALSDVTIEVDGAPRGSSGELRLPLDGRPHAVVVRGRWRA